LFLDSFRYDYRPPSVSVPAKVRTFRFDDAWEWNLNALDHHYLRACHAIQWGIEQYDTAKASTPTTAPVGS
jgi:hypothetical protein